METAFPHECPFVFNAEILQPTITTIEEVLKHSTGSFGVRGKIIWRSDIRSSSKCNQTVREAVLSDESGSIPISVWEEKIPLIQDGKFYLLKDMKLRFFNGKCLNTQQRFTEIREIHEDFEVKMNEETVNNTIICCPTILNGSVNVYPTCNNPVCRKKITAVPGVKLATCQNCNRKILLKNAGIDINASMQLEDKLENTHTITIFYDTIKLVVENVDKQEVLSDPDQLTASLLELENVDFEVAPNSNVAVKIYHHGDITTEDKVNDIDDQTLLEHLGENTARDVPVEDGAPIEAKVPPKNSKKKNQLLKVATTTSTNYFLLLKH